MGRPKPKKRDRRRVGARAYKNYSEEMLTLAVEMVRNKNVSSYDAEKQFGIPRRTIEKRAKNLHTNKPGPRHRFTDEEELQFVKVLIVASEFGCPLTQLDFRLVVFDYLKKNNKAYIFNDNPPGDWWVKNFLIRHHDKLTERSTQNIKKARAEKSLQDFQIYFENLKSSVKDLRATHILNYDETNLSDDPGAVKCIFRRGVKYPERIVNYSKGCISIMFAGTASGQLLDPYVVYKSENMWAQWCDGGLEGARYNRTKSGWFDSTMFMDWFTSIIIPWAQRLQGPKLVIGDNLSSHINIDVVELCERNNIRFVLLPPNSTQLTQPLDVAFFAPLKRTWRKILMTYKIENPKQMSLNKMHFPLLLKQLIEDANLNKADNLISGFRATGIFPYNPQKVYSKIPEYCEEITHDVDKSLLDYLKENRNPNPIRRKTNKKMNVPAGKSVTSLDINKDVNTRTCELTKESHFDANDEEEPQEEVVVSNYVPKKKKSKITILSEIIIPPIKNKNQKSQTTQKEERKAAPSSLWTKKEESKAGSSGFTTKREDQKAGPSGIKKNSKKDVKKKKTVTKRLYDSSSDSESLCSVRYADSSDIDLDKEDMQDYLLRQLMEDHKMEEQEAKEHETEKQVKKTHLESMGTLSDGRKGQEMERQRINDYEMKIDAWKEQEVETHMSELETKWHKIEKQVRKTQLESLRSESDGRKEQEVERQMVNEHEIKKDAWKEQEVETQMSELETKRDEIEKQVKKTQLESLRSESDGRKEQEVEREMVNEHEIKKDAWKEHEVETQMSELETKRDEIEKQVRKTQLESLRSESNGRKEQEVERQMVNEHEIKKDAWKEQEVETQMSELETKRDEIEKQVRKTQLESLRSESDGRKEQEVEWRLEQFVMKSDKNEKQEIGQQMDTSEMVNQIKGNKMIKREIEQNMNYISIEKKEAIIPQSETKNEQSKEEYKVNNFYKGQYILVKFKSTKNTNKYYCGQIEKISEREGLFATFMRYKNGGFYWPTVPDTSIVFQNDIIQILPNPYKNRRGIVYFDVKFKYKLE